MTSSFSAGSIPGRGNLASELFKMGSGLGVLGSVPESKGFPSRIPGKWRGFLAYYCKSKLFNNGHNIFRN